VGSPNVRGTAWMVIQHAGIFGHKRIRTLSIWKHANAQDPNVLAEMEDVV
jgi:hypothetical protein